MDTYSMVSDYFGDARRTQEAFVKRYNHPFLVILHDLTAEDDEEGGGSSFFTKAFMVQDTSAVIGGGPVLDPKSVVLPVKKKKVKASSKSPLASTVLVGRNEDNDLVIASTGISKYHFYIAPQPFTTDEYAISDNASTNGTFVNMKKVQPSSRVPLTSGDKITLGHAIALRFYLSSHFWEHLQKSL